MNIKRHFSLAGLIVFTTTISIGQIANPDLGARNAAMAGSSLVLTDGWSLFNNVGSLGKLDQTQLISGYRMPYAVSSFQTMTFGYVRTFQDFNAGIGISKFGDSGYNEQQIRIAIANKIQMVSLGGALLLNQYHVSFQPNKQQLLFNFGGKVEIIPKWLIGAFINNTVKSSPRVNREVPMVLKLGISYQPISSLIINSTVQKSTRSAEEFKFGMEYYLNDIIAFRTGFNTQTHLLSIGIGLNFPKFILDYAYSDQQPLGAIHEISINRPL
ncbi:MAG: hypothetical protein HQ474_09220 [Flammeovirgaceae bacterium]|jgi:hypothetical protein|nr:hypothetical protein [Flammeovirgaceae bacterium]|tara:strand:+ start:6478 stop:7287 length:810 start_codon:yes stop_codon:yes gene_type:complete